MQSASNPSGRRPTPPARARLLVVEDEVSTVFAMREFFAHAGYDVDCAAGPSDAARLLDRHSYAAVITDLHLTTQRAAEGLVVVQRARRENPEACIVMLTGFGSDGIEQEARRCGVNLYQTKPVELARLSAYVELALRGDPDAERRALAPQCRPH